MKCKNCYRCEYHRKTRELSAIIWMFCLAATGAIIFFSDRVTSRGFNFGVAAVILFSIAAKIIARASIKNKINNDKEVTTNGERN